jgi:HlyB family type I secretion system ABC transporter
MTRSEEEQSVSPLRETAGMFSRILSWAAGPRRRVPVMLQMSAVECGAACLAMILNFHGRKTRVSDCREKCGVGRDGATALSIARAARGYGLRVRAHSVELRDFGQVQLPAVVHWNFNHFVVVERWSARSVTIVDPAMGRRRLSAGEFSAGFTGVVLTFQPGVQFERRQRWAGTTWTSYLPYMLQTPGALTTMSQVMGASVMLQILGLALPVFTKVLIDYILPVRIGSLLTMLGLGVVVLVLSQMVVSFLRASLLIYLQARVDSRVMLSFFEHLLTLPFSFFQQRSSGDLLMRLASNTVIREMLTSQSISTILDGTLVIVYLGILLVVSPMFGLIVLAIGVVQVSVLAGTTVRVHGLMQRELAAQADSQSYLVQALSGIATLKASGSEDRSLDFWSNLFFTYQSVSLQRSYLSSIIETTLMGLRTFSPLLLLWFGASRVIDGTMSLGTLLALNALAGGFLSALAMLVSNGQRFQLVKAHLDRISDVLEAEPEQDIHAVQSPPPLKGSLEIRNVSFQYDPNAPLVLRDVSLRVEPGQKIALVGRTGSGKSTLIKLLLGLYKPTSGQILYDGLSLESLNYREVRHQMGVVLQESFLFSGSIRENILFNDPALPLERAAEAAGLAVMHDEIIRMPMNYETLVAEGGSGLSGGQRQRLSIARALAHRPALLLLDEATSHLDAVTEQLVEAQLNRLSCTRVVVAHRLSTVRDAELIVVLDEGAIVEQGSHEELIARHGYYEALVHHQMGSEADRQVTVSDQSPFREA